MGDQCMKPSRIFVGQRRFPLLFLFYHHLESNSQSNQQLSDYLIYIFHDSSISRDPHLLTTVTEESIGEVLPGPPFPSLERAGSSEAAVEKPFPCEHSAFYQQTAIDAASPKFAKGLARRKSSSNQAKKGPCSVLPRPKLNEIKRRTVPGCRKQGS